MQNVIQHILEVIKLNLKVTQVVLYTFRKVNLAQKGMVYVSCKGFCGDKTTYLAENGQISNRVQNIELLEGICFLFEDKNLLVLLKFEVGLIGYLKFALVCPDSL